METAQKQKLRDAMRRTRDAIPEEVRRIAGNAIAARLISEEWYAPAEELLVYSAIQSEVDLEPLVSQALRDGKRLYFPRVQRTDTIPLRNALCREHTTEDAALFIPPTMEFYRVEHPGQLTPGAFHVMEPEGLAEKLWKENARGVRTPILVPGLAFSEKGARLGYGKGYYDRYLAAHEGLFPVGVCFEAQIVEQIPTGAWDRPMERLVTEAACRRM